jgi:CRP/FNR family transcriptional regulator, polysaccharide utilization system transcription regulator
MNAAKNLNLSVVGDLLQVSHNGMDSVLAKLYPLAEKQYYKKGHNLFNAGAIARGLYIIDVGKVKVSKFGIDGKEQIIKILKSGDVLGYQALLFEKRFLEYAEVLEDAEIYYVSGDDFEILYQNDPKVMNYFTKLLCNDLDRVEERLVSTAYEPVRGRVAALLLELAEIYEKGSEHIIKLSRSNLANMAGTAKETTIRLLSEFKGEGLIVTDGSSILIKDFEGLKRVASLYH